MMYFQELPVDYWVSILHKLKGSFQDSLDIYPICMASKWISDVDIKTNIENT